MKVAVIVLNFNGRDYIGKCLESIKQLALGKNEVQFWVIDNASSDKSVEYLKKEFPEFKLISNSENLGYAEGNNTGIRLAQNWGADWIWIVNPDIEVDKQSLSELLKFAVDHPQAGIVGSKVYYTSGFESHPDRYSKSELGKVLWYAGGKLDWQNVQSVHLGVDEVDEGKYNAVSQTEFVTGASMLLRTAMLNQTGLFDPKYYLYYEENDLCQRALQAGWQLWYVPKSIVWHANAQATEMGSPLVDYYTTRNQMLFGMRWAPVRTKLALLRQSIRLQFTGRLWQKKGVTDFYIGRFGKGSYVN